MSKIPVSIQLWSLREDQAKDYPKTIEAVAKMGYQGVETAGFGSLKTADEAAKVIRDQGLKVSGMHVGLDQLRNNLSRVVEDALALGTAAVIMPCQFARQLSTAAACQTFGEEMDCHGAKLRVHGLSLSYHNHAWEMARYDGLTAYEHILSASEPRNLQAEFDVYWGFAGGEDPAAWVRRVGARCTLLHLKDGDGKRQTELGLGKVDFAAIFQVAEQIGAVRWYVVEQEEYNHAPVESLRLCAEQLRAWGKL